MSFSINASGKKEDALKQLDLSAGSGDLQHFTICQDALRTAVNGIPDGTVVDVSASGHHDYNPANPSGSFQLSFTVRKQ